jgi:hypothetical protein
VVGRRAAPGALSVAQFEGQFDVVGAERATAHFAALDAKRLGHGYLFSGPAGIGKKTFARRFAQSLLCERPKSTLLGYCNACRGCTLFVAGTHPDYHDVVGPMAIRRTPTTRDDETTALDIIAAMSLRPYMAAWRITVIGDIGFKSEDAANALLKVLEEPSPGVLFILTTDAPRSLLPTVRSRMVEIPFDPLTREQVASVLERDGVAPERAREAAAAALGSVTRARSLLVGEESGLRDAAIAWFGDAVRGRVPDQRFLRLDDKTASAAERRDLMFAMLEIVRLVARDWAAVTLAGEGVPLLAGDAGRRLAGVPARSPADVVRALTAVGAAIENANGQLSIVRPVLVLDDLRMALAPEG